MRGSWLVRIPMEFRAPVLQEGLKLDLPSTLDVMGHILGDYFSGKRPLKPETTQETAVTTQKLALETVVNPSPVTSLESKAETDMQPPENEKPETLYGGVIHVIS